MYLPVPPQSSCARAWVAAALAIAADGEAFNVIIDVDNPSTLDEKDHSVISHVDRFLRAHEQSPISTVVNTIFPLALYEEHGAPEFYAAYLRIFDSLSRPGWGRYFERMTRHKQLNGAEYNPLAALVERLRSRKNAQQYTSAYELAIYDPQQDGRRLRGGPCLSFLSFKLHPERGICLTAMYRNHTYVTRCLGNLIGLGRLQSFIANEAGYSVGSLTCISTHAELDVVSQKWTLNDARRLVDTASDLLTAKPTIIEGVVP